MNEKTAKLCVMCGCTIIIVAMLLLTEVRIKSIPLKIETTKFLREEAILTQCQYSKELTSLCVEKITKSFEDKNERIRESNSIPKH